MVKILPVSKLQVGQVLAEDVKNVNSQILVPKGVPISIKHLHSIKTWGIEIVRIREGAESKFDAGERIVPFTEYEWEKARESVAPRFVHTSMKHPVVLKVFNYCVEQKIQSIRQMRMI